MRNTSAAANAQSATQRRADSSSSSSSSSRLSQQQQSQQSQQQQANSATSSQSSSLSRLSNRFALNGNGKKLSAARSAALADDPAESQVRTRASPENFICSFIILLKKQTQNSGRVWSERECFTMFHRQKHRKQVSQHVWFFIIYCSLLFFSYSSQPTMVPSASTRALAMAVPFSSSFLSQAQQQQQQQPQQQLPVFHAYQQPQPHLTALHDAGTAAVREKER